MNFDFLCDGELGRPLRFSFEVDLRAAVWPIVFLDSVSCLFFAMIFASCHMIPLREGKKKGHDPKSSTASRLGV